MKRESAITLSAAAAALTLLFTQFAPAQAAQRNTTPPTGMHEAMQMVPAQAFLVRELDARKVSPGQKIQIALSDTVHLKNGPELPRGTKLIGTIATDDMNFKGRSTLALSFTEANLKNGKVVPIKATIVGVYGPESLDAGGLPVAPGNQIANDWNDQTLQIDQLDAPNGIELHSKIAAGDSGDFVSTKRDDIKLTAGSEIALAIAASNNS